MIIRKLILSVISIFAFIVAWFHITGYLPILEIRTEVGVLEAITFFMIGFLTMLIAIYMKAPQAEEEKKLAWPKNTNG